ncbi:hypothetical protein [Streptomyces sp. HNM1019]|uniref:hypothetical protein n=1 Tax=Streptomyces sp. HNM1019 TaxID=3424717 RepID=UPI003D77CA15
MQELDGREVWLVNAVHGIRPVTARLGRPLRAGPALRAASWQTWLNGVSEPLAARPPNRRDPLTAPIARGTDRD